MKTILIATSNLNKVKEYKELFSSTDFVIKSLRDYDISLDVEENGKTFEDNSLIKAQYVYNKIKSVYIVADDSGLCIKSLDNFPGIYSSRFMDKESYVKKDNAILEKMNKITSREAFFYCAITLIDPNGQVSSFSGTCHGFIDTVIQGSKGFGYDNIFIEKTTMTSFGTMESTQKNKLSHRGKACQKLLKHLINC